MGLMSPIWQIARSLIAFHPLNSRTSWTNVVVEMKKGRQQIGRKDATETKKIQKRDDRKAKEHVRLNRIQDKKKEEEVEEAENKKVVKEFFSLATETDTTMSDISDPSYSAPSVDQSKSASTRNMQDLSHVAREAMRWPGASDRMVASIVTATLVDFGVVTEEDKTKIVDQHKIRRAKDKLMKELSKGEIDRLAKSNNEAFYVDGKNIDTLCPEMMEDGSTKAVKRKVDHIAFVEEPGGKYVAHVTPEGKTGAAQAEALFEVAVKSNLVDKWKVVGGDSTSANTGWENGCFAKLEEKLGHRLHTNVCGLHTNELPLRHLIQNKLAKTSGSSSFEAPLGPLLQTVENLEWNDEFEPITVGEKIRHIPPEIVADLSQDQKYLWLATESLRTGVILPELKRITPGPTCHSRWGTTADRLLTVEMKKTPNLSKDFREQVREVNTFIVSNYAVSWFDWKCEPDMKDAPKHVLKQIRLLKDLPDSTINIVKPYIKSWYAHPESLLVSALCDDDKSSRDFAVDKILQLRDGDEFGKTDKRVYRAPSLNFEATSYLGLIDWNSVTVTESIITSSLSSLSLNLLRERKLILPPYPSHTQSVERVIREITDVSAKCLGQEKRHGTLLARYSGRKAMPKANTKRDMESMVSPVIP